VIEYLQATKSEPLDNLLDNWEGPLPGTIDMQRQFEQAEVTAESMVQTCQ